MSAIKQIKRDSKKVAASKRRKTASAFHGQTSDGENLVGVQNLRVVIVRDGDYWFAQGLEIDYAAQGQSAADVKARFQDGMCETIHQHLRMYGSIERFLKPAPPEVWKEMFYAPAASLNMHSQVSCHSIELADPVEQFPFTGIEYREVPAA